MIVIARSNVDVALDIFEILAVVEIDGGKTVDVLLRSILVVAASSVVVLVGCLGYIYVTLTLGIILTQGGMNM